MYIFVHIYVHTYIHTTLDLDCIMYIIYFAFEITYFYRCHTGHVYGKVYQISFTIIFPTVSQWLSEAQMKFLKPTTEILL